MARPRPAPGLYLLTRVSSPDYPREQTQQQFAERPRISRPTVSRLLQEAKEHGIVQISVAPPQGMHTGLEAQPEERFSLGEALVAEVERGQSAASRSPRQPTRSS